MKKQIIAAAVAAAFAVPAMAQVTVYGILSSGFQTVDTEIDGASTKVTNTGQEGSQGGSRLGFRGEEDLGGGLKAGFTYERGIANDSSTDSMRQAFVSLSGGFGEVRLGRGNSLSKNVYDTFNAHGGSGFAPGNQASSIDTLINGEDADIARNFGNIRHSDMISFTTPSFGGVRVSVQMAQDNTNDADGDTGSKTQNFGLNYTSGPLALAFAQDSTKVEADSVETSSTTTQILGASFRLGAGTVMASITKGKLDAGGDEIKLADTSVGAQVPMGSLTLIGHLSQGTLKTDGVNIDTDGYQIGVNYNFSKRTIGLLRVGKSELKKDFEAKADGYAIGVQHSF